MAPATASAIIAHTYDLFPVATAETRMVPAIAVPREEPRFEMLRDRPEISPCCSSGKLDCTTFTDGVSMIPSAAPIRKSPGTKATTLDQARTRPIRARIASRTPEPMRAPTDQRRSRRHRLLSRYRAMEPT